jgi:hypothetical protein
MNSKPHFDFANVIGMTARSFHFTMQILLNATLSCVDKTVENMKKLGVDPGDIKAVGITNQRETIIAWDKLTGEPLYNAIGENHHHSHLILIFKKIFVAGFVPLYLYSSFVVILTIFCGIFFSLVGHENGEGS